MWMKVTDKESLVEKVPLMVKVGGESIIIIKMGDELFALNNQCPHLGCPLHKGELEGYFLKCPCHDWIFDIRTGEFTAAPEIKVPFYQTKIDKGEVYVLKEGRVD